MTTQLAFDSDYDTVLSVTARRDRLDKAIVELTGDSEFTPVVRRLSCLRGISTLTAFALAVEIGDWHRFTGNSIGSFVGLVPSEYSSGASRVQGSITKPAIPTPDGCWSKPPGITEPDTRPARPSATGGNWPHSPPVLAATWATADCTSVGSGSPLAPVVTRVYQDAQTQSPEPDDGDLGVSREERHRLANCRGSWGDG
jgi:hypothetical protein